MESGDQYGPALPPGMVVTSDSASSSAEGKSKKVSKNVIGPARPPGMQKSSDSDDLSDEGALTVKMDPEMSPEYTIQDDQEEAEDRNDEQTVGPMPSEMNQDVNVSQVSEEFERRSKRMKDQLTVKAEAEEGPSKREEWMTELPPEMGKNFGLQNRTFSKGSGAAEDKDRSSWTETPNVKKEKDGSSKGKKRKREEEKAAASVRDQQLQQQVDEYNKTKRPESLMDMHSKKQKKKKKKEKKERKKRKERGEEEEKISRRPFDRDTDLQVNRFDDAQRKAIIQKSQVLNSKFTKGATTSHFL